MTGKTPGRQDVYFSGVLIKPKVGPVAAALQALCHGVTGVQSRFLYLGDATSDVECLVHQSPYKSCRLLFIERHLKQDHWPLALQPFIDGADTQRQGQSSMDELLFALPPMQEALESKQLASWIDTLKPHNPTMVSTLRILSVGIDVKALWHCRTGWQLLLLLRLIRWRAASCLFSTWSRPIKRTVARNALNLTVRSTWPVHPGFAPCPRNATDCRPHHAGIYHSNRSAVSVFV